jgi:hypothetical protein
MLIGNFQYRANARQRKSPFREQGLRRIQDAFLTDHGIERRMGGRQSQQLLEYGTETRHWLNWQLEIPTGRVAEEVLERVK